MRGDGRGHPTWVVAALLLLFLAAVPADAKGPPPQLRSIDPAQGPTDGGTQVTLSGKHFSEVTSVDFDGVEVPFEDLGNDRLAATSPAHAAGTVQVTVTTSERSASIAFEYVAPPAIDSVSPGQGSPQGGDEVTIEGSGLADTTAVRFGSVDAASFQIVDGATVHAVTPQHAAGTVELRVETPHGVATGSFTFTQPSSPPESSPPAPPVIDALTPAQGPTDGGTGVTVDGSGLGNTTGVFFGDAAASFDVVDDTRLLTVTPAHAAGTVGLRVETPEGSASHDFTFLAPSQAGPQVIIDDLAPASGPTAGGTQVAITGQGLANVTSVAFGGVQAESWTIESDARLVAVTPPHAAGTVQVALQHPQGTATASFTYEDAAGAGEPTGAPSTTSSPAPPAAGTDGQEDLQNVEADPVETSDPADVVGSGAPAVRGNGSCWVLLAPSTQGKRVVVPFADTCDVEAVVVKVPDAVGLLNVSVTPMQALPADVPSPGIVRGPGLVFEAVIRDLEGNEVAHGGAVLQVRMPGAWLESCPPDACATRLYHYDGAAWSTHPMRAVDQAEGFLVLQADVSSFSLFAVGGAPMAVVDARAWTWPWLWIIGGVAMVGTPVAVGLRRRRTMAEDPKVGMLLREMSDKEELLQFLNNAAHDLANPLTPIQLQLDLLEHAADKTDPEEQRRALRLVQQNVEQMTMLVGDLRDAAKVRSGRLRFFPSQHELGEVIVQAAAMMEAQAQQAGVRLVYEPPGMDLPVRIDRGRIMQVVTNLLGNAIKFTSKGGEVKLTVEAHAGTARVRIADTGLGMSPGDQAGLFAPFTQAHGDREKAKGTGLGLYISKGIVKAHDGRIGCHSDGPGKGSTFWFTLPLDASPKP